MGHGAPTEQDLSFSPQSLNYQQNTSSLALENDSIAAQDNVDLWNEFNPDLEFGGFVDPFSEAFLSELQSMDDLEMGDWTKLLM